MKKTSKKIAVTALTAAMVLPVFTGTLGNVNVAHADAIQEVENKSTFQLKKNIITIQKGDSLPDINKNLDEYFYSGTKEGKSNPVVSASFNSIGDIEQRLNDENTPLGYYTETVVVQLKDGTRIELPFVFRTVATKAEKELQPAYAKVSVKKGEKLPSLAEIVKIKGIENKDQELVYDAKAVNTDVEGEYLVPVEIKVGGEVKAKTAVLVSVVGEVKENDKTTDITVSEDDKTEKVYVVSEPNFELKVGDKLPDLKEAIKVADAEGKEVKVKEVTFDKGHEIDTTKEGEGIVPLTVTFEDGSKINVVAKYKVSKTEEENSENKELEEAKAKAIKELEEAGITSDLALNKIKNAKTVEEVETIKAELLKSDKKEYTVQEINMKAFKGATFDEDPSFVVKDKDGKVVATKKVELDQDLNKLSQKVGKYVVNAKITLANGDVVDGKLNLNVVEGESEETTKPQTGQTPSKNTSNTKTFTKEENKKDQGYKLETKEIKIKKGEKLPDIDEYIKVTDKDGKEVSSDDIKEVVADEKKVDTGKYGEYTMPVSVKLKDKDIELKGNIKVKVTDENGNVPGDTQANEKVKTGVAGAGVVAGILGLALAGYKATKKED